jgi:hypothetical protein
MTLTFFAGDRAGECWPSGMLVTAMFGSDDVAAALYFCELHGGRQRFCAVHDWDRDEHDQAIGEDDLSDDERQRLTLLRVAGGQDATDQSAQVRAVAAAAAVDVRLGASA